MRHQCNVFKTWTQKSDVFISDETFSYGPELDRDHILWPRSMNENSQRVTTTVKEIYSLRTTGLLIRDNKLDRYILNNQS